MRRRSKLQRGQAMVESALVLLVFSALLIGSLDIGQVMFFHNSLVERARHGARWASTKPFNEDQIKNVVVYGSPTPAPSASPVLYNLTLPRVSATLLEPNTVNARVTVTISNYPFNFFSPWIAGAYTANPIAITMTHEPSLP